MEELTLNVLVDGKLYIWNLLYAIVHYGIGYVATGIVVVVWAWRRFKLKKQSDRLLFWILAAYAFDALYTSLMVWLTYADSLDYVQVECMKHVYRALWFVTLGYCIKLVHDLDQMRSTGKNNLTAA